MPRRARAVRRDNPTYRSVSPVAARERTHHQADHQLPRHTRSATYNDDNSDVSDNQSVCDRSYQLGREYGAQATVYAHNEKADQEQFTQQPHRNRQSFQGMNWNYTRPSSDNNSTLTLPSSSSNSAAESILSILRAQGLENIDVVELLLQGEEGHIAALNLLEARYGYAKTSAPLRPYGYNRGDVPQDVTTKIYRIYDFFGMEDVTSALSVFAGKELRLLNVLEKKWRLPLTSLPLGYNGPEEAASMDLESKVRSIHHHYRLPDENATLAMYEGQELRLLNILEKKYGLPITRPPEEEQDDFREEDRPSKRGKPSQRRSINKALAAKRKKKDDWKYTRAAAGGAAKGAVIGAATGVLKGIFYSPLTTICCGGTNLIHRAAIGASVGAVKGTAKAVVDTAAKNGVYGFQTLKSGMKTYHKASKAAGGYDMFESGLSHLAGDNSDNDSVDPTSEIKDKAVKAVWGKAAVSPKKGSRR